VQSWTPLARRDADYSSTLRMHRACSSTSLLRQTSTFPEDASSLVDRWPTCVAAAVVLLFTSCGAIVAKVMMGLTWIEAIYFCVTTVTTVGYGDINPVLHGPKHKHGLQAAFMIFHSFFIVIGVAALGAAVALVLYSHTDVVDKLKRTAFRTGFAFVALAAIGALGASFIEGWDWMHGTYWAVVTLSTVGYGHLVPQSDAGRVFASVLMLAGAWCQATLFTATALLPAALRRRRLERLALERLAGDGLTDDEMFELAAGEQMKKWGLSNSDQYVSRNEFCLAMLLRFEKISGEDLAIVQETFDKLDTKRTGRLELEHNHVMGCIDGDSRY